MAFKRFRNVIWLIVLAALAVGSGCSKPQPASLIVLPGATKVYRANRQGMEQVTYKLKARYPARAELKQISDRLAKQGWKPLKESYLDPSIPTSHVRGWTEFIDSSRGRDEEVRQWGTDWTNSRGDVATYTFVYRWIMNQPQNIDSVTVYANHLPRKLAEADRKAVKEMQKKWRREGR